MFKISSENIEKYRKKSKKGPILFYLDWSFLALSRLGLSDDVPPAPRKGDTSYVKVRVTS